MQDASGRNGCHICIEEIWGQEKYKEKKINSSKSKWVGKTVIRQYVKSTWNISAKNVGKSKTEQSENNRELFHKFPKQSPSCVLLKRCSPFLKNTSGRLPLEFLWRSAPGEMVKWPKSNGEHFQMFQKQSPRDFPLKSCLSFLKNTSWGMLLEFLKNRYIVRRDLLFFLSSQKNSLLFDKNLEK